MQTIETEKAGKLFGLRIRERRGGYVYVNDEDASFWVPAEALAQERPITEPGTDDHADDYAEWCREWICEEPARESTAERVAALFGNDGALCYLDSDGKPSLYDRNGKSFAEVCEEHGARGEQGTGDHHDDVRFEFPDGSCLILAVGLGAWDYRSGACECGWCWSMGGEEPRCVAAGEE